MTDPRPGGLAAKAQALWDEAPLAGQPLYCVFWRKRFNTGSCRKYLSAASKGFTENRFAAWKTTDRAEAERRAANIRGGVVAEWKPDHRVGARTPA